MNIVILELVTSLKLLQSDWLMKCKYTVAMTLRGAKTTFLDTSLNPQHSDSKRRNDNTGLRIVAKNGEFTHMDLSVISE